MLHLGRDTHHLWTDDDCRSIRCWPSPVRSDAVILSTSAVGSQWFIYSLIKEFGALVFAATMNVRQVVSILISYAKYGHSITALQIVGLVIIFGALFYKSFSGLLKPTGEQKP